MSADDATPVDASSAPAPMEEQGVESTPATRPDAAEEASVQAPEPIPVEKEVPKVGLTHADRVGFRDKHAADTAKVYFAPGKGLTVESADGLFKLATRVRGQFLYELEADGESEADQLVTLRRARVVFGGHAWGKDNTFKMELAVAPRDLGITPDLADLDDDGAADARLRDNNPINGGTQRVSRSPLLDLYLQFKQHRDFNVRVGQYKIPFSRQRVISSGNLMFVDRSIVNSEFTLDRDIGFDLRSSDLLGLDGKLRYYVGVYTGEGHSSFRARGVSSAEHFFGLNTLVRLEVLPFGAFEDYDESDLERTQQPALSIGASFAHVGDAQGNRGVIGSVPSDDGTTDFVMGELDAMFKYRGLSAQAEFMLRKGQRNVSADVADFEPARDGWGLTGQVGYLTRPNVEVAVRHSAVRGRSAGSLSDSNETGFALGYYLAGHPYKLQADYLRLYGDDIGSGVHQVRVQLQFSL